MSATWLSHGRVRAGVLVLAALFAVAMLPGISSAQDAPDYVVTLSGSEQVPDAVETDATGVFTATMTDEGLDYTLQVSGTGLVQAHIHLGAAGANGPVIAFLFALEEDAEPVDEIDVSGTITVEDLLADLEGDWDGFLAALATDNLYVNVHSGAYPAGEIRGQIVSTYDVTLSGAEQVPEPVETEATGLFRASYDAETDMLNYELVADGDDFVQAHIHLGAAGTNGPVIAFLFALEEDAEPVDHIHEVGSIGVDDLLADLEGDWDGFLAALGAGNLYANVHSAAYPAGELRGQIVPAQVSEPEPEPLAIGVAEDEELGAFLTGPDGLTLYIFTVDEPGVSNCSGPCAEAWPPLTVEAGQSIAPADGIPGTFGMIEREDGSHQVTYNDAPLYYFAGDAAPGDTNGQGVNDVWFVASVQEDEPEPTPTAEPTAEPTEEPTEAPTEAPTATPTEEPTVAPTTAPPTNTPVAPSPPDTGSAGVTGGGSTGVAFWLLAMLGLAAIGFGASTIYAVNRR